jgi:hypothetical protein
LFSSLREDGAAPPQDAIAKTQTAFEGQRERDKRAAAIQAEREALEERS